MEPEDGSVTRLSAMVGRLEVRVPGRRLEEWPRWALAAGAASIVGFVLGMELAARRLSFDGPTVSLVREFAFGPERGRVLWAGLALAMVGLVPRARWWALGSAAVIDAGFIGVRFLLHDRPTYGNGALIVLAGLGVVAATRWSGQQRIDAIKGVCLGLLLVYASKMGDTWLRITASTRPMVLDQYVQTADHALGNPSWILGRWVDAGGVVVQRILETVYIDLPLGAMVVAVYQLRKGWVSHHLVRTFLAIGLVGPLLYLAFPVVGPMFAFGAEGRAWALSHAWPNVAVNNLHPLAFRFDAVTPRNCMPSLHTAWALSIFLHSRRGPRWLRAFGTFWFTCTLLATLGFGWHYGVDLVAGVVFALTVEAVLRDPERGWGWFRWRLVGGGLLVLTGLLLSYRFLSVPMAEAPGVSGPAILAAMAAVAVAFHATFFAAPGTALARWGQPELAPARAQSAPATA
jgi:hypothetical protein